MKYFLNLILFLICYQVPLIIVAQINFAELPVSLKIGPAGDKGIRITVHPLTFSNDLLSTPILADESLDKAELNVTNVPNDGIIRKIGDLTVRVRAQPLTVEVTDENDRLIQSVIFLDGKVEFDVRDNLILGMGEGGPLPPEGVDWTSLPVEYNRLGRFHEMQPRWQAGMYGSRNPVPLLIGTSGWAVFFHVPWGSVDLSEENKGIFIPRIPEDPDNMQQTFENQQQTLGKGIHPPEYLIPGLVDMFVFDASDPHVLMKDLSEISGSAVLPPLWSLGYMQSHRTLENDEQMVDIIETFRSKEIPVDALIYLGTGFTPRGWNTEQPSFDVNPAVFTRPANEVFQDLHDDNVKVILHMVPWDRDKLATLHGNIPPGPDEKIDASHLLTYWNQHNELVDAGVDGWWPDEGDWFNLFERMKRHQLYYQGPLSSTPNVRPWSLHRNGFLGIAKWGGWVWSGDTHSTWKSLEAQIAVGINHSLSLSPYWGSDIGGFFPTEELTGDLYVRWFQFGAFTSSFRSHGRTWWTRLPWGWGREERGPLESDTPPLQESMNDPTVEPIIKKYAELRSQLMSYNYTLSWEATQTGIPMMRSMWIDFNEDPQAVTLGDQYMWGSSLLIAPVYEKDATERTLYLPSGEWYDWWTNNKASGEQRITREVDLSVLPIYVKAGTILPLDPVRQFAMEQVNTPMSIRIYRGDDGSYMLYEDDGVSLDYLNGEFRLTEFLWDDSGNTLTIRPANDTGDVSKQYTITTLPDNQVRNVDYRGESIRVSF